VRVIAGNGLRPDIWDEFTARFNIPRVFEFYGASEGNTGFVNIFNVPRTAGICPTAVAFVEYDPDTGEPVRDDNGRVRKVHGGQPGLLLSKVSDKQPFEGYTDASLTAAAFVDGGWYATGDVGVIDEDGYLTITDRKKDIIIRGGENVSAAEVEDLLLHIRGVAEVAVVAAPDPRLGEHACAFVRLVPSAESLELERVRSHLAAAGLARQKWPEELRLVPDFPRTASGKVQKFVLRQQLRAGS